MTYVMKVPVRSTFFCVNRTTQTSVETWEEVSAMGTHTINVRYYFDNDDKADLFYNIIKQVSMYQRYERYRYRGARKRYNQRKEKFKTLPLSEYDDVFWAPKDSCYTKIFHELDLNEHSEPEDILFDVGILGTKYSYDLILDRYNDFYCIGWKNADAPNYIIPGIYRWISDADIHSERYGYSCYLSELKRYKKVAIRSNRMERYRQEHQITR